MLVEWWRLSIVWAMRPWFVFLVWYTWDAVCCWKAVMRRRLRRSEPGSPSNKHRPEQGLRARSSLGLPQEEEIENLSDLLAANKDGEHAKDPDSPRKLQKRRAAASGVLPQVNGDGSLEEDIAPFLDMDHVHLTFWFFLWGRIFIGLGAWASMIFGGKDTPGILRYGLRRVFNDLGVWPHHVKNARSLAAELLLETTLIHSFHLRARGGNHRQPDRCSLCHSGRPTLHSARQEGSEKSSFGRKAVLQRLVSGTIPNHSIPSGA